jgi:hypothetical protein
MEQYLKTIAEAEEKIAHLQKMYLSPPPKGKGQESTSNGRPTGTSIYNK